MSYEVLMDPGAVGEGAPCLSLPAGTSLNDAAEALRRLLTAEGRLDRVRLIVGGDDVGATSSAYVRAILGMQKDRGPGDEVRAALPGESTRFSVIAFRCVTCGSRAYTAFYDDRYRPLCRTDGHGPMVLRADPA